MKRPLVASIALAFVLLNAVSSLSFSILILLGNIPGVPDQLAVRFIMTGLAFAGSVLLFVLYFLLVKHNKFAFYLTLAAFALITILVFADEIGLADWAAFGLSVTPLVLLILGRNWFLTS
jgi:hypothetical protein